MSIKALGPSSSPLAAFGTQLRRSREARRMTQAQLGVHVGCTGSYVSYVERAERMPQARFARDTDAALETGRRNAGTHVVAHPALRADRRIS
ncbi:helix-turn-helix domain-containing protein [Kitasatospora indigofera]|uniref:helix-turn-helix domain-containing protein n=1 Tax=Kitasatospora indigofera TaxID=67307 RepID=UPI0033B2C7A6